MRVLVAISVLLATVSTVLVAVRQHSELRRLESDLWDEMRRRDGLEKQVRELEAELSTTLAPRQLLEELESRNEESLVDFPVQEAVE